MNAAAAISTDVLAKLYPFAKVDAERLEQVLPLCHKERFLQTLDPFRHRDWSGQMVYLTKGQLKVTQPDGISRVLVGGADRALFPVSQAGKMPISSKAITDVEFLRIEEDAADLLITWDQCANDVSNMSRRVDASAPDWRMMSGMFEISSLAHGAFATLPPANIGPLLERFERQPVKRGDVLIKQGDAGDYYYLLEQGRCLVTRDVAGSTVELAELKAGDAFGADALISDSPRNATVTMRTDGTVLKLAKEDFNALLRAPLLHNVGVADAVRRISHGAMWMDVRFAAEYQHDGLPKAVSVPLNELREAMPLLDINQEYIVYCQTGRRSAAAAFLLAQRGFNALLLEGGLRALGVAESAEKEKTS